MKELKSKREAYLELGICVIGAITDLHKELEEPVFNLPKIVEAIHENTMSVDQMKIIMDEVERIGAIIEIKKSIEKMLADKDEEEKEEADDCYCEGCPVSDRCQSYREEHVKEETSEDDGKEKAQEVEEALDDFFNFLKRLAK